MADNPLPQTLDPASSTSIQDQVQQQGAAGAMPGPAQTAMGGPPMAPPPGTPGVQQDAPVPAAAPPANPAAAQQQAAQQQAAQQQQEVQKQVVAHAGIGKAFTSIMGGQAPGQFFRGILASMLIGGAAGAKEGNFTRGMSAGVDAQRANQQLQMENQLKQQKAQQESQAAMDEHQYHQAATAHENASTVGVIAQNHAMDQEAQDKLEARNAAVNSFYKNTPGAQPGQFTVDGQLVNQMSATEFMKAATQEPSILRAADPGSQTRHFIAIPQNGKDESVTWDDKQHTWVDAESGKPAYMPDHTMIQAWDIPTNVTGKPQMVSAKDMQAMDHDHKNMYKDGQFYSRTPEEITALQKQNNDSAASKAETNWKNAEAEDARAKAKREGNPSINDVYAKYNIPQGLTGQEVLQHLPAGLATAIDKLSHYDWDSKTFNTWIRNNAQGMTRQEAMTLASMVNTNYHENLYGTVRKTVDNYNDSKKEGGQIDAFNRFIGHAGEAADVTAHWRTSNAPILNKHLNELRNELKGDPQYTKFIASLTPVRKEYNNFLNQNRAEHEADLDQMKIVLSDDSTPAQIEQALKIMAGTAVTQARDLDTRFKTLTGYNVPNFIQPYTKKALQKLSDKNPKTGDGRDLMAETEDMNTGGTYYNAGRQGNNAQTSQTQQQPAGKEWSASAWLRANPQGNVNAATAAAKQSGLTVIQ